MSLLPSSSSSRKMESALLGTLTNLQIRSSVEECMNSMLLDVEATHYLRQELQLKKNQQEIHRLEREQKATILEAQAEHTAREKQRAELADKMVIELMVLSRELEGLILWKKEHEEKVEHYDELAAKLAQTEEELQAAQRISYGGGPNPHPIRIEIVKDQSGGETSKLQEESHATSYGPQGTQYSGNRESKLNEMPKEESIKPSADDTTTRPAALPEEKLFTETIVNMPAELPSETVVNLPLEPSGTVVDIPNASSTPKATDEGKDRTLRSASESAAVVVALDEEETEEEVPGLVEIDVEILMTIFGFLDALDILNTAQINLSMYQRVDNIFGISEDGQSPPQPTPPAAAKPPPPAQSISTAPKPAPIPAPAAPSKPAAPPADAGPLAKGLFSMLQPRAAMSTQGAGKRGEKGGSRNPWTASLAHSITNKLSNAEVAAILSMTDKLSKMEKEVDTLRNEKEGLAAKLEGTEAVKQFLIGKVREVELKLSKSHDDEIKVAQQIASDQEVIAFLDSRVQELERQTENIIKEKTLAVSELQNLKVSSSKRITMLSDMLKYEREKLKDEEGEWKATKKVLVKEVKSCRAQILALQAERDGFKEQNEMLKRAIVATGNKSPNKSSSGR